MGEDQAMNEPQFFQTRMGQQFFERTMPELVKQIARMNELLERIATGLEREHDGC